MVASTHWLASAAGMAVLEKGGNAFDAAVAAGFTLQVVEPHLNGPGGEVPVIGHDARRGETFVVCGQGTAPAAATLEAPTGTSGSTWCPAAGCSPRACPARSAAGCCCCASTARCGCATCSATRSATPRPGYPLVPAHQLVDRQRRRPVPRALAPAPPRSTCPAAACPRRAARFANPRARRHLPAGPRRGGGGQRGPRRADRGRPPRLVRRLRRRGDRQVRRHRGDGRHRGAAPRPAHRRTTWPPGTPAWRRRSPTTTRA